MDLRGNLRKDLKDFRWEIPQSLVVCVDVCTFSKISGMVVKIVINISDSLNREKAILEYNRLEPKSIF